MHTIKIDGINYNLTDLEKDCWVKLLNGSLKGRDALHNAVVANTTAQGTNMRTVVLRKVNTSEKTLAFHTDMRSGKWQEINTSKQISWLFYDVAGRYQIRLAGTASLHHDDTIAADAWLKSTPSSRKIYMGEIGPSQPSNVPTSGLPLAYEKADPTLQESEAGRKNFGVVVTNIHWMEWLWLNSQSHRRASFVYDSNKSFQATWLIP